MLEIERLGGFAGFGGGALRSRGRCNVADLSPADRAAIERFFAAGTGALRGKGTQPGAADMFTYRITRQRDGRSESVEVPEALVPASLRDCVKDTLE